MVTHDMTEITEAEEGALPGQVVFFIFDIFYMVYVSTPLPSPTTNIFPLLTLLFIRGLSCPSFIQASISLNCFKLTIPGFPYHCLPVSCGDTG